MRPGDIWPRRNLHHPTPARSDETLKLCCHSLSEAAVSVYQAGTFECQLHPITLATQGRTLIDCGPQHGGLFTFFVYINCRKYYNKGFDSKLPRKLLYCKSITKSKKLMLSYSNHRSKCKQSAILEPMACYVACPVDVCGMHSSWYSTGLGVYQLNGSPSSSAAPAAMRSLYLA